MPGAEHGAALQPDQTCRDCGTTAEVEVWTASEGSPREIEESGRRVVYVTGTPAWAVEYALQGVDRVTRYSCPRCGEVLAVLASDPD